MNDQPTAVSYGFFEGWIGTHLSGNYFLADLTAGEQSDVRSAANRDFISDTTWSPLSGSRPTRLVTIWMPESEVGQQFTLHMGLGSLQWLEPVAGEGLDPDGQWRSGFYVSAAIGVNQDFQLVRQADQASAHGVIGIEDLVLDWSTIFQPYVPPDPPVEPPYQPNTTQVSIEVGENHWGDTIALRMSDGSVVYPTPDWGSQSHWIAYDANYVEIYRYPFVPYRVTIDGNLGWIIECNGVQVDHLMDGYQPPQPPEPPTQVVSVQVGENHWSETIVRICRMARRWHSRRTGRRRAMKPPSIRRETPTTPTPTSITLPRSAKVSLTRSLHPAAART